MKGEKNPQAKLTKEQVDQIRELITQGIPGKEIAKQFAVSSSAISRIKRGKTWN